MTSIVCMNRCAQHLVVWGRSEVESGQFSLIQGSSVSHYTNAHSIKPFTVNKTVSSRLKTLKILKTFHSFYLGTCLFYDPGFILVSAEFNS